MPCCVLPIVPTSYNAAHIGFRCSMWIDVDVEMATTSHSSNIPNVRFSQVALHIHNAASMQAGTTGTRARSYLSTGM